MPVLNEARWLRDTVARMSAQRLDGSLEVVLIDGGSTDGSREIALELARQDPRIRLLHNPRGDIPSALNVGLAHARGDYIVRMDAHSWYPPDYLGHGVERLRRGDVEWVTGPAVPRGTGRWSRRVALALSSSLGQGGSRKWGERAEEVYLDTGVFGGVWTRETLRRLGGWNEGWRVNEDVEMAARVLGAGGRIVCRADMATEYAPRDGLAELWQQYWRFGYYRAKTARRYPIALRRQHLASAGVALTAVTAVVLPGRLSRLPRAVLGVYALSVTALSVRAGRAGGGGGGDAAALTLVFATMHLAWGVGFLTGCGVFGVPVKGIAHALVPKGED